MSIAYLVFAAIGASAPAHRPNSRWPVLGRPGYGRAPEPWPFCLSCFPRPLGLGAAATRRFRAPRRRTSSTGRVAKPRSSAGRRSAPSRKRGPGAPAKRPRRNESKRRGPASTRSPRGVIVEASVDSGGLIARDPRGIYRGVRETRAAAGGRVARGLLHRQGIPEAEPGATRRVLRGAGPAGFDLQGGNARAAWGAGPVQNALAETAQGGRFSLRARHGPGIAGRG